MLGVHQKFVPSIYFSSAFLNLLSETFDTSFMPGQLVVLIIFPFVFGTIPSKSFHMYISIPLTTSSKTIKFHFLETSLYNLHLSSLFFVTKMIPLNIFKALNEAIT